MGMYTELVFKAHFNDAIPDQVEAVLCHLFMDGPAPQELPEHEFFRSERWDLLGSCCSFYHTPFSLSRYENPNAPEEKGGYVFSRSDLKNYDNEIAKFLDWVMPYVDEEEGMCLGWTWYEEDDSPTLIYRRPVDNGVTAAHTTPL